MTDIQSRLDQLTDEQRDLYYKRTLKKAEDSTDAMMLLLKAGDESKFPPLFCLHPPLGTTGYYINLATQLHPDQAVYGIQSPALYGIRDAFDNYQEMARILIFLNSEPKGRLFQKPLDNDSLLMDGRLAIWRLASISGWSGGWPG